MRHSAAWIPKLLQLLSHVQHLVSAELTFLNVAIIVVTSKAPQVTARGQAAHTTARGHRNRAREEDTIWVSTQESTNTNPITKRDGHISHIY